jgi:hypothetical protein
MTQARGALCCLLGGLFCLAAQRAHAEPLDSHASPVQASLGARVSKVADAGFDPFASSDDLPQVSLGVGATVLKQNRLSLAAVGFWDYGSRSDTARGAASSLDVHRLSIGPELRYRILPPLYLLLHVLPAFAHSKASLYDGAAQASFSAQHWSYGVDAATGAACELYAAPNGTIRPRLWAIAEGGYGYLGRSQLLLRPESGQGAPERSTPVDLGALSLSGAYLRISAAVSF